MSKTSGSAVARRNLRFRNAVLETLEPRLVLDGEQAHVLSSEFQWVSQPTLQYTLDVEAERTPLDVYLANLLTGQQYFGLGDEIVGPSYTESFPTPALGDGYFEAVLRGAKSPDESEMANEFSSTFFSLGGDANHDGSVDDGDQNVFIANYGGEGTFDFTQGDFNYDGAVDDADGDILAARYGTVLQPPPNAPNTLVLNTLGPRQITFTWQAPEGITPDGFRIFRSSDGGETQPYTLYKTINDGSATSWQENNVPDGAKYYYRVRAFRTGYGSSITTNAESIVTTLPAPDQLSVTRIGDTGVTLNWRDQSNNESGYEIWAQEQSSAGGPEGEWALVGGAGGGQAGVSNEALSGRVDLLSPDTIYAFRIRAVTAAQNSIWSPEITATTLPAGVPTAPTILTAVPVPDGSRIELTWTDNSDIEEGFEVWMQSAGAGNFVRIADRTVLPGDAGALGQTFSYTATGLIPGTGYAFRVRAVTEAFDSMFSQTLTTETILSNPDVTLQLSGPAEVNEGSEYTLDIELSGIDAGLVTALDLNWGDGEIETIDGWATTATHMYADGEAARTVTATASASGITLTADSFSLTVRDVAPRVTVSGFGQVAVNEDYRVQVTSADAGQDTISSWDIDWGDGASGVGSFIHQYTAPGTYVIRATASNEDGDFVTEGEVRVFAPGSPIATFGAGGTTLQDFGYSEIVSDVAVSTTGDILVVGYASGQSNATRVTAFQSDGSLDLAFGNGGSVLLYQIARTLYTKITTLSDGRIVVGGTSIDLESTLAVACISGDGELDQTFGSSGYAYSDFGAGSHAFGSAISIQKDGKIVLGGRVSYGSNGTANAGAVARFNDDGSLDASFGTGGRSVATLPTTFTQNDFRALAVTSDGRIILGGISGTGYYTNDYTLIGFNSTGVLDTSFGNSGIVRTDFQGWGDELWALTPQEDGGVIAVGQVQLNWNTRAVGLARYSSSGILDTNFGTQGLVKTGSGANQMWAFDVATQPDGKLVIGGAFSNSAMLARYNPSGSLDATFGQAGFVTASYRGTARGVALGNDGSIVTAGEGLLNGGWHTAVSRYMGNPPIDIAARRTGGRFGQTVSEAVEDSQDPKKYLILTNNDYEQNLPDGQRDYADEIATIPSNQADDDDDLGQFTLRQIGSNLRRGTLGIELSNPGAVRLFKDDGTLLWQAGDPSENLQLDLSATSPAGYLAGIRDGDLDVWIEGLTKDTDFKFALVLRDEQGRELARDDVHMLIAEWKWIGADGNETEGVANIPKDVLVAAANGEDWAKLQDREKFKIRIDGVSAADLTQLRVTSDDIPNDFYTDDWVETAGGAESADFAVLYNGADLTPSERALVKSVLGVEAVHNGAATAAATTQSVNAPQQGVPLSAKQLLLARIQDEENKHKNAAYYVPTGLNTLFARLTTIASNNTFKVVLVPKGSLGKNTTAQYLPGTPGTMSITSDLTSLTATHETIHAENQRNGWHTGNDQEAKRADEAMAYGIEKMLATAAMLRRLDVLTPNTPPTSDNAPTVAKAAWAAAWGSAGFPKISAGKAAGGDYYQVKGQVSGQNTYWLSDADMWDINGSPTAPKYGIHFSAGILRPVYENLLAANGITEVGGGRLYLAATTIPATNYFA